jgi:hypothetical protein
VTVFCGRHRMSLLSVTSDWGCVSFRSFVRGELRVIRLFSRSLCSEQGAFCQTSFCGNVPEIAGFVDTVKVVFMRLEAISPAASNFTQAKSGYLYADQQFRF